MIEPWLGAMPEAETDDLGRYLEDTITIDWQTPSVSERARQLLEHCESGEARVEALFEFVRDEIRHSADHDCDATTCRASEVLEATTGLCCAKSHLLAGLLRYAGYPTGFCYARLVDSSREDRFSIHGFVAVQWPRAKGWVYLDPCGDREGHTTRCRFEPPWSLSFAIDVEAGEGFFPLIYKRPAKKIIDLLERAGDFATVLRNWPDSI